MGVYIKGMEMPTKGYRLILIHADGTAQSTDGETTAVPVPPHGRLIDKDVMCNECRRIAEEYDGIYPDCTYCPAHLAPTIIPAEENR